MTLTHGLWFLTGGMVSALNTLTLWWTVGRLCPRAPVHATFWALGGAALRWGLGSGLLMIALRHGTAPLLWAFGGLWSARWGAVYVLNKKLEN